MTKLNLLIACLLFLLVGCSSEEKVDSNGEYFKTFDHVLNDQYIWHQGHGGIYWVSNDKVVLDAYITGQEGQQERGLYQIDVTDGSYTKLIDTSDVENHKYCFDGRVLYVRAKSGDLKVLSIPKDYSIEVETLAYKAKNNSYSKVRCRFVERPTKDGYTALLMEDGFIKLDRNGPLYSGNDKRYEGKLDPKNFLILADEEGNDLKVLGLTNEQFSSPRYLEYSDSYFGFKNRSNCVSFWWLKRGSWQHRTEKKCFGNWAKNASKIYHPIKEGTFIQHYTSNKYKSYIVFNGNEYALETIPSIGGDISPDGCRIAYGSGGIDGKPGLRQVLKIFDACEFMRIKGE